MSNIVQDKDWFTRWFLNFIGKDVNGGALADLAIGRYAIDTLLNGPDRVKNSVPSHSIYSRAELPQTVELADDLIITFIATPIRLTVGNSIGYAKYGGWLLLVQRIVAEFKYWMMKYTSCAPTDRLGPCLEKIYNGQHDLIVSELSQTGRLGNGYITQIFGPNHMQILDAAAAQSTLLRLFREQPNSTMLSDNGWNPARLKWDSLQGTQILNRPLNLAATDSVKIVSPAPGVGFNRGDSVLVRARATSGITKMLLMSGYESGIDAIGVYAPDSVFRCRIPADVAQQWSLRLIGFDNAGNEVADSLVITINPGTGGTITSVRFVKPADDNAVQVVQNDSTSIDVLATYSDGSERNITRLPGVTYTSLGGLLSYNGNGEVKGLAAGFDQLQVSIGGFSDTLSLEVLAPLAPVAPPTSYFFTGNGNWSNAANWRDGIKPPAVLPAGAHIYIDPLATGSCLLDVAITLPASAKLTVLGGKQFRVTGGAHHSAVKDSRMIEEVPLRQCLQVNMPEWLTLHCWQECRCFLYVQHPNAKQL